MTKLQCLLLVAFAIFAVIVPDGSKHEQLEKDLVSQLSEILPEDVDLDKVEVQITKDVSVVLDEGKLNSVKSVSVSSIKIPRFTRKYRLLFKLSFNSVTCSFKNYQVGENKFGNWISMLSIDDNCFHVTLTVSDCIIIEHSVEVIKFDGVGSRSTLQEDVSVLVDYDYTYDQKVLLRDKVLDETKRKIVSALEDALYKISLVRSGFKKC